MPIYHRRGADDTASGVEDVVNLTDQEIFDGIKHNKDNKNKIIPGNRDLKILAAWRKLPGYDYYVSVEYDVIFLDDPRSSIERLLSTVITADLCASFFCTAYKNEWMWWDSLAAPEDSPIELKSVATSAFLPLVSFSDRFARSATACLEQGWRGHQEALWPTIAALCDLSMLDFEKTVPKITSHAQFGAHAPNAISINDSLYAHPIKTMAQFRELPLRAKSEVT